MDSQTIAERYPHPKPVYKTNLYGQVQYSAYSRPTHSYGKYSAGGGSYGYRAPGYSYGYRAPGYGGDSYGYRAPGYGGSYGYRAPGYGTNWGTSFPAGVGSYKGELSGKAVGLGVGPGFLGGSAVARLGVAATVATYAVYHRWERSEVRILQGMYRA